MKPFENNVAHWDKATLLGQIDCFQQTPVDPKKCQRVLSQLICLLYSEESLEEEEATELFFRVIQLFQIKQGTFRSSLYLVIKRLAGFIQEGMMVTQSLLQDIDLNTTSSLHRSQALRALGSITKTADLHSLERIMKAAIVDPHPWVRSAVIVAIDHHLDSAPEKVRRWSSWLQEAIYSPPSAPFAWFQALPDLGLAQYHGLGLLSRIRWTDPMALTKLVHYYAQKESHPLTLCHWIRCARQVMEHQPKEIHWIYACLVRYLHHPSDWVQLEAARAIGGLPNATTQELTPVISVLQKGLGSSQPVYRFACLRLLDPLALRKPKAVVPCHTEIERCITEPHLTLLALMTLLKIAVDDASFEHRLTQLGPCLQTVQDSEKLTWIRTLAALGLKYPRRQYPILTLLITLLHQKESLAFKQDLMEIILGSPPSQETREIVLSSVCQWIDENHFSALSFTLLSFLATEAPKSLMPARYGPPIARHLASDDPALRLAAVNALAALASHHQKEIQALLRLSLQDHDPNVRQRTEQILQHPQSPPLPSPVLSLSLFFKQTPALHLSEPETEYPVRCLKYICARHIVFQFDCSNTLDHTLENLEVIMHSEEPRLIQTSHSSIPTLPFNTLGSLFVVYEHQHPNDLITASFHCQLRFSVKRTQEAILEDEYQLENVQLSLQDYLKPIRIDDFDATFDSFSTFGQTHHFHFLTTPTLQTACTALIRLLALQPLRDTALVRHPERHTLLLSGITLTEETVLVQAHLDCNSASLSASVCIRTHHKTIASHLFSFLDHSIKNSLF